MRSDKNDRRNDTCRRVDAQFDVDKHVKTASVIWEPCRDKLVRPAPADLMLAINNFFETSCDSMKFHLGKNL